MTTSQRTRTQPDHPHRIPSGQGEVDRARRSRPETGQYRHAFAKRFFFEPETLMGAELTTGFHTANLRTMEVLHGPPLSDNPFDDVLRGRRIIAISLGFDLLPDPIWLEVPLLASGRFRWPLPGEALEVLVRVRAERLNNTKCCCILSLTLAETMGRHHAC
ncbi:MAG: hypothetical protein K2Y04_10825 [Caulobacteraceae bacterium]|nr:hypothetical protein [Caulobacteraceae bacterium]